MTMLIGSTHPNSESLGDSRQFLNYETIPKRFMTYHDFQFMKSLSVLHKDCSKVQHENL